MLFYVQPFNILQYKFVWNAREFIDVSHAAHKNCISATRPKRAVDEPLTPRSNGLFDHLASIMLRVLASQ